MDDLEQGGVDPSTSPFFRQINGKISMLADEETRLDKLMIMNEVKFATSQIEAMKRLILPMLSRAKPQ